MRLDERYVWLDPRHDFLAQFGTYVRLYDEVFSVPPFNNWPLLHQHFARGQQAVISAQSVYGFHYFDGTSEPITYNSLSDSLDFAEIASWKDYLVCLTIVPLHMTAAQVFASELFGATCEELVKLVDPMDITLIQRLSHVYDPDDKGVKGFFDLALDTPRFYSHLEQWKKELVIHWVRLNWLRAYKKNFRGIFKPEDIWIGPGSWREKCYALQRHGWDEDDYYEVNTSSMEPYMLNFDHPWVRTVLDEMPTFQPTIMFRVCMIRCYKIPMIVKPYTCNPCSMYDISDLRDSMTADEWQTYLRDTYPEWVSQRDKRERIKKEEKERAEVERIKLQRR